MTAYVPRWKYRAVCACAWILAVLLTIVLLPEIWRQL